VMTTLRTFLSEEEPIVIKMSKLDAKIGNLNKQFVLS